MNKISVIFILFFVSNSFAQSSSLNAKDTLMIQAIVDSMKIELKRQSIELSTKISDESSSKSTKELKKENDELKAKLEKAQNDLEIEKNCVSQLKQDTISLNKTIKGFKSEKNKWLEEKTKEEEKIKNFLKNRIQILNEEKEFRNITLAQLIQLLDFTANQTFLQNEKKSLTALVEFKKLTEAAENAYNVEYEEGLVTKCSEDLKKYNLPIEMNKLKPFKDELTTNLLFYKGQLCVVKSIIEKVNKAYSKKEQSSFRLKTIEDETLYTRYLKYPNSFIFKALDTSVKEAKSIITFVCP